MIQSYIVWAVGSARGYVVSATSVSDAVAQVDIGLERRTMRLWAEPWEPATCARHRLSDGCKGPLVTWASRDSFWVPTDLLGRFPEVEPYRGRCASIHPDEVVYRKVNAVSEVELARQLFVQAWTEAARTPVPDEQLALRVLEAAQSFVRAVEPTVEPTVVREASSAPEEPTP